MVCTVLIRKPHRASLSFISRAFRVKSSRKRTCLGNWGRWTVPGGFHRPKQPKHRHGEEPLQKKLKNMKPCQFSFSQELCILKNFCFVTHFTTHFQPTIGRWGRCSKAPCRQGWSRSPFHDLQAGSSEPLKSKDSSLSRLRRKNFFHLAYLPFLF